MAAKLCALNLFFGRDNELQIYHGNLLLMDNKQRKLFVIKQSKGCKVMPKMHSNMSGGLREGRGGGLLLTGRKGGEGGWKGRRGNTPKVKVSRINVGCSTRNLLKVLNVLSKSRGSARIGLICRRWHTAALCITAINYYYFCSTAQQSLTFSVKIIIISIQSGSVFVALANLASGMGVAFRKIRELNNYVTLV